MEATALEVDPMRWEGWENEKDRGLPDTGIYVRAKLGEKWGTYDISVLTKPSLLSWLRSRGGDNPWAENVVGVLLGHGHLYERSGPVVVRGDGE